MRFDEEGAAILKKQEYPAELLESINALSRLVTAKETVESTVGRIAELSVLAIDAADACGISLVTGKRIHTVAVTSDIGNTIDALQIETGEGPCMSSIKEQATFYIPDMSQDETWPVFSSLAAQATGISSLLGYVLQVGEGALGAMNVMSFQVDAFDAEAIAAGALFAAQAGVALSNALTHRQSEEKVEQLEEGIRTRQVIGEAVGIVMATRQVNADEAFEILKTISQHTNVKLKEVAAGLVERVDEL
ncbi:MAG TPA: GAF and ANTAR domain-containing protein [Actinomycetota bacterium]|nr:GAF and ANTAR domain-containing protein [Actinomycetota bacterium]